MFAKKVLLVSLMAGVCSGMFMPPATFAEEQWESLSAYQALSTTEADTLVFMREEEKLARDVYIKLYRKWKLSIFKNISRSEQQHTSRIKMLIQKYGLVDPVIDDRVGVFTNTALTKLYWKLVRQGNRSSLAALKVGAFIEEVDIADLKDALKDTQHPDIANVYNNLMKGSRNHLRAFVGQIENRGVTYKAQVLSQEEVDAIVDSPRERGG